MEITLFNKTKESPIEYFQRSERERLRKAAQQQPADLVDDNGDAIDGLAGGPLAAMEHFHALVDRELKTNPSLSP